MLTKFDTKFKAEYEKLNSEQKLAVETIEGPVMVIAGPGTGKTQILALRICNILQKTDTDPSSILCLTYTDQGSVEMRNRLISFMGADAYKVPVYTYHAFAKKVIQENPDFFDNYLLEPLSDIERIEVIKEIIDSFEFGHILKRVKETSRYFDRRAMDTLYQTMKKEGWSSAEIEARIAEQLRYYREDDPNMKYQRKYKEFKAGDLKINDYKKKERTFDKTLAAAKTFDLYEQKLAKRNRFDYADMINWCIDALKNEEIRLNYQERYLYLLADEFQDSNNTQIEILNLLAEAVDQPNLFVVGDDDQSIYRFQGANMENLQIFAQKYKPQLIILLDNYRSSSPIVEASKALIANNKSRLVKALNLDKDFRASGTDKAIAVTPKILEFENVIEEETYIFNYIKGMKERGEKLSSVGVLFSKHALAEELVKVLTKENISVHIKRKVDLLKVPFVKNILKVLELVNALHNRNTDVDHLIAEFLNLPGFDVSYSSIYKISKAVAKSKELTWMDALLDDTKLTEILGDNIDDLSKASQCLQNWIKLLHDNTLQVVFQHIIEESGLLNNALMANDNYWKLELLNTLFDYIKDESAKNPDFNIDDLNSQLAIMSENGVPLNYLDIISDEDGVQFMTCHGSKGMQFDIVFILGSTQSNWKERNATQNFTLPNLETQVIESEDNAVEEKRRLYYVAMTRAKKELNITFSKFDTENSGTEQTLAMYGIELIDAEKATFVNVNQDTELVVDFQTKRMTLPKLAPRHWIDKSLLHNALENYVMNVTHVNKYIKCPIAFYFEVILRAPSARTSNMGYGNAVHHAFERFIRLQFNAGAEAIPVDKLYQLYKEGLDKYKSHFTKQEFGEFFLHGKEMLDKYHTTYSKEWLAPKSMDFEKQIDNVVINGVPMRGNLDRIDEHEEGWVVYDYKTGSKQAPKVKPPVEGKPETGEQWRQIITYSLLMQASPEFKKPMIKGILDFTESTAEEKLQRAIIPITAEDQEYVAHEIREVYDKIRNQKFEEGCGKDKCRWCTLVQGR